jgi:hypothetical protein
MIVLYNRQDIKTPVGVCLNQTAEGMFGLAKAFATCLLQLSSTRLGAGRAPFAAITNPIYVLSVIELLILSTQYANRPILR